MLTREAIPPILFGQVEKSGSMGENIANQMEEKSLQRPPEREKEEEFEKNQGPRVQCSSCSPLSVNEAQCSPSVRASTSDCANIWKSGVMAPGVHQNMEVICSPLYLFSSLCV
jgi:hypothetical protein